MKTLVILALICVNLVLVVVLVNKTASQAQAQIRGGAADYVMFTSRIGDSEDALIVIDLKSRGMAGWYMDDTTGGHILLSGRDLERDFRPLR